VIIGLNNIKNSVGGLSAAFNVIRKRPCHGAENSKKNKTNTLQSV